MRTNKPRYLTHDLRFGRALRCFGEGGQTQGCIIRTASTTVVFLRNSICLACCAMQRQPGGQAPFAEQCPKPNMQRHSTIGSSSSTQRSYSVSFTAGLASATPPPTPRRVLTSRFRARIWMILPRVGREMPVASASSWIRVPAFPARPMSPRHTAAMPTCLVSIERIHSGGKGITWGVNRALPRQVSLDERIDDRIGRDRPNGRCRQNRDSSLILNRFKAGNLFMNIGLRHSIRPYGPSAPTADTAVRRWIGAKSRRST